MDFLTKCLVHMNDPNKSVYIYPDNEAKLGIS